MGGHGGLNILPQKKWNVYNWDNRDIVEKDKRQHAQKQRKQFEQNRQDLLDRKMAVLKEDGQLTDKPQTQYKQSDKPVHSLLNLQMRKIADQHKHINLFEEEERLLQNKEMSELKRLKQQNFLRDKNMDFSTRFLGSYGENSKMPWYSKKKGFVNEKPKNKHYKNLDDVIYASKTDSKVTKEIIETEKRQQIRNRQQKQRDRTRERYYRKYEQYDEKCSRFDKPESKPNKDLMKHEEDMLVQEFKSTKQDQFEKLRQKRLKRQQKQRQRVQQLKKKSVL